MAMSKCLGCGGTTFELSETSPQGSRFKFHFIQCSKCGGVVGVVDYFHNGSEHNEIKELIEKSTKSIVRDNQEAKEVLYRIAHYLERSSR